MRKKRSYSFHSMVQQHSRLLKLIVKPWEANGLNKEFLDSTSRSKRASIPKTVQRLLKLAGIIPKAVVSQELSTMKVKQISMRKSSTPVKQTLKCLCQSMKS